MQNSVGIVETKFFQPKQSLALECGRTLSGFQIAYETYGALSANKDNAVLICHALSGDAHAAGIHSHDSPKPGWWDIMIGPGKPLDTDKYFIICSNVIGGCTGSSGPSSIVPETGSNYGLSFPVVTIGDMVQAQKLLIDHLAIDRLLSVVGGSIGGMQTLEWSIRYPEIVYSAIALATAQRHSALAIAFNEVARQAIMADPNWNNGDYYAQNKPATGLAVARMIGHITYLSDDALRNKFGRRLQDKEDFSFNFDADFQVESYLRYQGSKFVDRFDANSFLYITKAADYFDLKSQHRTNTDPRSPFAKTETKYLVASFTSDWLYPTYQSKDMVRAMKKNNRDVSFCEIEAQCGHDAFLLPNPRLSSIIKAFLERMSKEHKADHAF